MSEILISKGAYIDAFDIIYLKIKILFLIKVILHKLRKLNKKNKTPLHYAAENNSKEMGAILIAKGADVNAKDDII